MLRYFQKRKEILTESPLVPDWAEAAIYLEYTGSDRQELLACFGEAIGADVRFGWPDAYISHGTIAELESAYGLTAEAIAQSLNPSIAQS